MSETPIETSDRRGAEKAARQEFGDSLRLLDRITSWVLWSNLFTVPLVLGAIVLLTFPGLQASLSPSGELSATLLVRGLLSLIFLMNVVMLLRQRYLKMFRKHLIEQMDTATKQRVRADKYYGLSILDALTGLYNRRFGESRLREEIGRAEKSGEPLLILALDFDRFKDINDTYGHAAGDLALKTFSRRLQRAIRACDVPIRVGGDEFLLILPECSPDKVDMILSRMHPVEVNLDGQKFPVSFSHGMAQYQVNDTPETMIRRADERLYEKKAQRAVVEV
jgi:diguanylate cyclase (GGDEF)-like protein